MSVKQRTNNYQAINDWNHGRRVLVLSGGAQWLILITPRTRRVRGHSPQKLGTLKSLLYVIT